jgi:hypothetical protein
VRHRRNVQDQVPKRPTLVLAVPDPSMSEPHRRTSNNAADTPAASCQLTDSRSTESFSWQAEARTGPSAPVQACNPSRSYTTPSLCGGTGGVVKLDGPFPFQGEVVWLTAEQGGRKSGPPVPPEDQDYAVTAFVPPHAVENGLASFVLRGFQHGEWRSLAEGRWLVVENDAEQLVEPGSVVVVTEGPRPVAYFHVGRVIE